MFDNISFKLENFSKERFYKLVTKHIGANVNSITYAKSQQGGKRYINWENLRIEFYPHSKQLWIKNSIHKFYNTHILNWGAYNHNTFTLANFNETVLFLCNTLDCYPNDLKLFGHFEFGLNIIMNQKPFSIISRFDSIVTTASNPFYVMPNEYGKPIEKRCDFTNYAVKFYDKGKQAQVKGKILRYEFVCKNIEQTRKIFGKLGNEQITLQDLLNVENWHKCYDKLINVFGSIRKTPFADNLSPLEYASVKAYTDTVFMEDHKKILSNKNEYKKVFAECKEVYQTVIQREGTCFVELKEKFKQTFESLILEKNKIRNVSIELKLQFATN